MWLIIIIYSSWENNILQHNQPMEIKPPNEVLLAAKSDLIN